MSLQGWAYIRRHLKRCMSPEHMAHTFHLSERWKACSSLLFGILACIKERCTSVNLQEHAFLPNILTLSCATKIYRFACGAHSASTATADSIITEISSRTHCRLLLKFRLYLLQKQIGLSGNSYSAHRRRVLHRGLLDALRLQLRASNSVRLELVSSVPCVLLQ